MDFLHAEQNGGVDGGCYEASIQKKLEDSCIILMHTTRSDSSGPVLDFRDCKRMNAAFIVFSSGKIVQRIFGLQKTKPGGIDAYRHDAG